MKKNNQFINLWWIFIFMFMIGVIILMFYIYTKQKPPWIIPFLTLLFLGLPILVVFMYLFLKLNIDKVYFRGIMIGITAGLAVWVLQGIDFDLKEGVWSTFNILNRIITSLVIIVFGHRLYKKLK